MCCAPKALKAASPIITCHALRFAHSRTQASRALGTSLDQAAKHMAKLHDYMAFVPVVEVGGVVVPAVEWWRGHAPSRCASAHDSTPCFCKSPEVRINPTISPYILPLHHTAQTRRGRAITATSGSGSSRSL